MEKSGLCKDKKVIHIPKDKGHGVEGEEKACIC